MTLNAVLLFNIPWIFLSIINFGLFKVNATESTAIILWYYFLFLLGLLFFPVTAGLFPKQYDRGYGVSRLLSTLFLFFINWFLTSLGILRFDNPGLFLCMLFVLFVTHWKSFKDNDLFELMKKKQKEIFSVELVFFFTFCAFLIINSFHAEIYWGEKPMDFNLLNFATRNTELPFEDPWFSGRVMNYYYFGYYFFSGLIKMSGISSEIGYALALATSAGLMASALFSVFFLLTRKILLTMSGIFILVFGSNLKSFMAIAFGSANFSMDYFWSSTRVFPNGLFAEYPSWSFLFMDLHPHVMAYPFCIVFLFFLLSFFQLKEKPIPAFYFFMAMVWGSLMAINSWDFILYSLLAGFLLLFQKSKFSWNDYLLKRVFPITGISFLVVLLYFPMLRILSTGRPLILEWNQKAFQSLEGHFYHSGQWWLICLFMTAPWLVLRFNKIQWRSALKGYGIPLLLFTLILGTIAENIIFMDRTNTIFKTFNQVYIWGGILSIISLRYFRFYLKKRALLPFAIFSILVINSILLGTFFQIKAINNYRPFGYQQATLKGMSYLTRANPSDYEIIKWMNRHILGTPHIVERYSSSFDGRGARISMHTGLPSYLGWDNHVYLRGASGAGILKRKREIDFIFNSLDPLKVQEFLIKKNLKFLIIGPYEKASYNTKGLAKFSAYKDQFKPLVSSGNSTLYGVGDFEKYLMP